MSIAAVTFPSLSSVAKRIRQRTAMSVVAAMALLLGACGEGPAPMLETAEEKLKVSAMVLEPQLWRMDFAGYGHFESTEKIRISIDFSGTVNKVHFRDGQTIRAGQVLIELDQRKQALRLRQMQANLSSAKADLQKTRATWERHRKLSKTGALSREQLRQTEADFERAKARVKEAEAAMDLARKDLRETTIISPVDGVIDQRQVEPGQTVLAGEPLATVQVTDTLRVVTYVTEKEVNQLQLGDEAAVTSPAVPGREYVARIESVASSADPNTGNFVVKLTVNNSDQFLRAGMSASIRMRGVERQDSLVIPKSLMVDRMRRRVVYRYENGVLEEVSPVLGVSASDEVPVIAGLRPGDVLITDRLELLVDGKSVELINPPAVEDDLEESLDAAVDSKVEDGQVADSQTDDSQVDEAK